MKKTLFALLAVSVAMNLWLLARPAKKPHASEETAAAAGNAPAVTAKSPSVSAKAKAETATEKQQRISKLVQTIVALDSSDPAGARDRLRAAGADEVTVYGIVDGMLRLRFYQGKRLAEIENLQNGWWRGGAGNTTAPNMPLWGKTVVDPVLEIVGYDPHDLKDFASRFDFLPPEKAQTLAKMSVDYFAMHMRFTDDNRLPTGKTEEVMLAERQKDLLNLLTPEERAEYDLRFSPAAEQNISRFARMPDVTEKEFRAIMPIVERMQKETTELVRGQALAASTAAVQQRAMDDLVAAVGYERAADYVWAGANVMIRDPENPSALVISSTSSSPRIMQLAAETGAQAAAIHNDPSRSADEKRAALLALQQTTQPKLESLLPPEGRSAVDPQTLGWFDILAKGQYVTMTPRLTGGAGTSIVSPISVTGPIRGTPLPAPVLRQSK
jgi:hypothetical protein